MSDRKMKKISLIVVMVFMLVSGLTACGDGLPADSQVIIPKPMENTEASEERAENIEEKQASETMDETMESKPGKESEEEIQQEQKEEAETQAQQEELTVEEIPEPVSLTISAAGDVTLGNYLGQGFDGSFRQTYENTEDKSYFFQNVYDIFSEDDMTIVNLEGTLTFSENPAPDRTFNIKGDPEYAYLLNYGAIEAVGMANNHRMDFGEEGAADSVEAVKAANIAYAYDNVLGYYETKGIRIGWVSVNELAYGNGIEKQLEQGINKLKEEGVHLILACCHWGIERENYPTDYQKQVGRKCIDWGADLVIGHHPHVLQGIEAYQGKYIIYSLGNFCFGANKNPADKDTMIFQQTFTFEPKVLEKTMEEAQASVDAAALAEGEDRQYEHGIPGQARIIPCSVSSVTLRNDYCPTPLTGEEGQRVIGRVNEYSLEFGVSADETGVLQNTGMQ